MTTISRVVIDALMPGGSLWNPEPDGDFDRLLDGIAENNESMVDFLRGLGSVRNPEKTSILEDLEREFGVETNTALTELQRRIRLAAVKADKSNDGTDYLLEQRLQASGFDVYVHQNDPAVDPSTFIFTSFNVVYGHEDAVYGYEDAILGQTQGLLISNGNEILGFESMPTNPVYWPLVFFIGGAATRAVGGSITNIENAVIQAERKDEFIRLVVKYKPLHAWAGVVATFT